MRRRFASVVALSIALVFATARGGRAFELARFSDGTPNLVAPALTANPIEVVLSVRTNVSAADEAWITASIRDGLDLWEQVPTSHVRFTTSVVHSAGPPAVQPGKLTVDVTYDATSGGATLPSQGNPGRWNGALASIPAASRPRFEFVVAHEIGHALGILHSTISDKHYPLPASIPVMHFNGGATPGLASDDVAAISVAYPDAAQPLGASSGTVRGRCVSAATGLPMGGVNVVAVDAGGIPRVARLSGAEGAPGRFELVGLPPGAYTLDILDGRSFGGLTVGMSPDAIQADNFVPFSVTVPSPVGAGAVRDVGDVAIATFPMSIDRVTGRDHHIDAGLDPAAGLLPAITSKADVYVGRLHVRGGVHPIALGQASGLGATTAYVQALQTLSADPSGDTYVHVVGYAPPIASPSFTVTDADGASASFAYELPMLLLNTASLRWKTPFLGLKVDLKGTLAKPSFDPLALPAGGGAWRLRLDRVAAATGAVTTYYDDSIPSLVCASARVCVGTATGTTASGKSKLSLRLTRGKAPGEWSFRVTVTDDPLTPMSAADQTVRISLCPLAGSACLVGDWPFRLQRTNGLRYRP